MPYEPYANVDKTLRGLAGAAEGFGGKATGGGKDGAIFTVDSLEDSGPGTLREACSKEDALWIVFSLSGTITLSKPIMVKSNKTIDGRGQKVLLQGSGFHLKECSNIIICNLLLNGGRGHDADAIKIKPNSKDIWIDRCSLSDFDDGLIDITRGSTDITVSRCHFFHHNKAMLIGGDAKHIEDRAMRVTVHGCFFDGTRQRHPRVRFARVHLYNNYTRAWAIYAVCASVESQVLSQHCIYEAGGYKKAFEYYCETAADKEEEMSGQIRSEGDIFSMEAEGVAKDTDFSFNHSEHYSEESTANVTQANAELAPAIAEQAGWHNVPLPLDEKAEY